MLIFYEFSRRLNATLEILGKVLGDRPACVARELTKIYEEFLRYSLSHLCSLGCERDWRGEITLLLVAGCDLESRNRDPQRLREEEAKLRTRFADLDFIKGRSNRDLVKLLMVEFPLLKCCRIYEIVLSENLLYMHSE